MFFDSKKLETRLENLEQRVKYLEEALEQQKKDCLVEQGNPMTYMIGNYRRIPVGRVVERLLELLGLEADITREPPRDERQIVTVKRKPPTTSA